MNKAKKERAAERAYRMINHITLRPMVVVVVGVGLPPYYHRLNRCLEMNELLVTLYR
jgi:hypothetical protein